MTGRPWAFFLCLFQAAAAIFVLAGATPALLAHQDYLLPDEPHYLSRDALARNDFKFAAITIDDVPHPVYCDQILAVLLKHKARATFFVNGGRVKAFPDLARKMVAAGHEIGNHTFSHPQMTKLSHAKMVWEMESTQEIVKKICGVTPRFYRPPFGLFNAETNKVARDAGLITLLWSIDTLDWQLPGVSKIEQRVLGHLHNGAVILVHGTNAETPVALDYILTEMEKSGYIAVTASEWYQLAGGKAASFDMAPEDMPDSLRERLYDIEEIVGADGKPVKLLIPKRGSGEVSLSELKLEDGSSGGVFSNLKYVEQDDLPPGLADKGGDPPGFYRPPVNSLELVPDGRGVKLALTDSVPPAYDPLFYPRQPLIMVVRSADLPVIDTSRLDAFYKAARFDFLAILRETPDAPEADTSALPKGIPFQAISNATKMPVFCLMPGGELLHQFVDMIRQKRRSISVLVTPALLGDDPASLTEAARFISFRALSGAFTYDPGDDVRERWQLPPEVEIARFTGYNRIVLMCYSRTGKAYELKVTGEDEHLEILAGEGDKAQIYTKLVRGTKIGIGGDPVYIVYRWGSDAAATQQASG